MKALSLVLLFFVSFAAQPAEVAGVRLDDKTQVESRELVLNGAGLRKRFVFNVYVIGLYLPEKGAIDAPGPKRLSIHMLRNVGAEQFTEALVEGLRANHSDADFLKLEPRVKELSELMAQIGEAKKGMAIALDWTGSETRLLVNGKPAGKPIAGEDFYRALLRIWIGEHPVQDDLKRALLGA
jgi:Chalcone isomerase-like